MDDKVRSTASVESVGKSIPTREITTSVFFFRPRLPAAPFDAPLPAVRKPANLKHNTCTGQERKYSTPALRSLLRVPKPFGRFADGGPPLRVLRKRKHLFCRT